MADKTIEFDVVGDDKVVAAAKRILEAEKKLTAEENKLASVVKRLAREQEKAAKKAVKAAEEKAASIKRTFAVIGIAVAAGLKVAVTEFASNEAALGRLERSFGKSGASAQEYSEAVQTARDRSVTLGESLEEQVDGLSQLLDATGDVTTAQNDLNLAMDIAAQERNVDLAQAVETLRKVRVGEVEELKNLNGITKLQAETLAQIVSPSKRAEEAQRLLSEAYAGAAEENRGTENTLKALTSTLNLATAAAGSAAVAFGEGLAGAFVEAKDGASALDTALASVGRSFDRIDKFAQQADAVDVLKLLIAAPRAAFGADIGKEITEVIKRGERESQDAVDRVTKGIGTPRGAGAASGTKSREALEGREGDEAKRLEALAKEEERIQQEREQAAEEALAREAERDAARHTRDQNTLARQRENAEATERFEIETLERKEAREKSFADAATSREVALSAAKKKRAEEDAKALDEIEKKKEEARNEAASAVSASAAVVGQAANEFIKNEQAKAVVQGLVEIAKGAAAAATLTPQGFISAAGHGVAAAAFFAAAGQSGGGGKGGSKRGGGGGGGAPAAREEARRDTGLFGESDRAQASAPAPIVLNINTAFPPRPQQARDLVDAMTNEQRNRTT